jgi:predicted MFS family arabinose efflux permease
MNLHVRNSTTSSLSAITPGNRARSSLVFDTGFGIAWFAGSAIMGLLYDRSIVALVIFSMALQLLSLPIFAMTKGVSDHERLPA